MQLKCSFNVKMVHLYSFINVVIIGIIQPPPKFPTGIFWRRLDSYGSLEEKIYTKIYLMQTWVALALCSMFFAGLTSVIAKFGLKNIR